MMFVDKTDAATTKAAIEAGISSYVVDGLRGGRPKPILDAAGQAERQEVVELYIEGADLADAIDRQAFEMANGMRQRVGICPRL
jgi:AmiR/NasT family two-component response regulator